MSMQSAGEPVGAIVDRVQANLIAYFRLFAGLPGVQMVVEDVTWFINERPEPGNHVLRTHLAGDTERRIDEILGAIAQRASAIDWLVFPGCRPADLGRRLATRGLPGGPGGIWMLADLAAPPAGERPLPPAAPPAASPSGELRVDRVQDRAGLALWGRLTSAGFGHDAGVYVDAYARHLRNPDAAISHYIGYAEGEPVISSTLLITAGIAGIYDLSTPPAHRRRGFGRALTLAMLAEARRRGARQAWIWSSPLGVSVYRAAGFTTVDLGVREYRWSRNP